MNIFATSHDPVICARNLDDSRVGKMLIETCQLLSFALIDWSDIHENSAHIGSGKICKWSAGHAGSGVALWARKSHSNWMWLYRHGRALDYEFVYRFGKAHGAGQRLNYMTSHFLSVITMFHEPRSPFHNSAANDGLGISYKGLASPTQAYKLYLNHRWNIADKPPKWSKRGAPTWREKVIA